MTTWVRFGRSWLLFLVGLVGLAVALGACGEDVPEPTIQERLEEIAGEPLSSIEVAAELEKADVLCQLDDQLLLRLWAKLDEQQFEFQEFVFNYHCPDRSVLVEEFVPPPTSAVPTTRTSSLPTTTRPVTGGTSASSGTADSSQPSATTTSTSGGN